MKLIDKLIKSSKVYVDLHEHMMKNSRSNDLNLSKLQATQKENAELLERVTAISEKISKVSVQRSPDAVRYRICVELDSELIQMGLIHGNDHAFIDYLGQDIGHRAAQQIRQINYERWEK